MIVLSVGLQKSGSTWYFNLTNDLLVVAGHQDARIIRQKFHFHSILRYQNCVVNEPTLLRLAVIAIPHFFGIAFVIKTHSALSATMRSLMSLNIMKATYIYRDPRDAAVSAFEFGQIIRNQGETHTFAKLHTLTDAIRYIRSQLAKWDDWTRCNHVLTVRYEDLLTDPVDELNVPCVDLQRIATSYRTDQVTPGKAKALHFNIGSAGRFAQVMNQKGSRAM